MIGQAEEGNWPAEWLPYAIESLLYKKEAWVGTVLPSSVCHYCGAKATTEDHIVPRCDLPAGIEQPYWFRSNNVVAACSPCNWTKGRDRSDCTCDHCTWAWKTALACLLPVDYQMPPTVLIVRSPG